MIEVLSNAKSASGVLVQGLFQHETAENSSESAPLSGPFPLPNHRPRPMIEVLGTAKSAANLIEADHRLAARLAACVFRPIWAPVPTLFGHRSG